MFKTLLIANRGEIACRVAATARRLGIRTIAVYSDADADSRHVAACDVAVQLGGPAARDSYLRADAVLAAAQAHGADAIHPGYGFLSENAPFAEAVEKAGMAFVGPPASAIAAMGSKSAAKALMAQAGVPLVPGYHGDRQDAGFLRQQADAIGYPVLIKASAGGGGKGMRVVASSDAFDTALSSCRREAAASFGDEHVLVERYLQKPRHIEIQVFADTHGTCLYVFDRDCSVQRRHQKVVEEAPAPGISKEIHRAMGEAAVAAASAVGYVGAGTVEFIVEPDGTFYFMEMNTRLQVEHPVTEMITGFDLVAWQLRVAAGEPLDRTQADLRREGHAIEARIYAENPENHFLPSTGKLVYLGLPDHVAFEKARVRVDSGVQTGDTITPHYDPMIAKLIVHGTDRDDARRIMLAALAQTHVVGVQTNVAFLMRLMSDEAFATGDLDTGLIERRSTTLLPGPIAASETMLAVAAAAQLAREHCDGLGDPWSATDGWRVGGSYRRVFHWRERDAKREATLTRTANGAWTLGFAGFGSAAELPASAQSTAAFSWCVVSATPTAASGPALALRVVLDGQVVSATVVPDAGDDIVFHEGNTTRLTRVVPGADIDSDDAHGGGLTAPMPGKIIAVNVRPGAAVKRGAALLVMEAMKMEHTITAPHDGTVGEVFYAVGDQVADGAELLALATE